MDSKRMRDLIKLAKIKREVKEKNIQQDWEKEGYELSLKKFHKPVIEQFEEIKKFEESRNDQLKALSEQINDLSLLDNKVSTPLALEGIEKKRTFSVDPDYDLDLDYLKLNNFPTPIEVLMSENINEEVDDLVDKVITKLKELGNIKSQIKRGATNYKLEDIQYKIDMLRLYKQKLKSLKAGKDLFQMKGSGFPDGLIHKLESLTEKLNKGNKSKKLHNEIVTVLDALFSKGDITKDQVIKYYHNFLF